MYAKWHFASKRVKTSGNYKKCKKHKKTEHVTELQ